MEDGWQRVIRIVFDKDPPTRKNATRIHEQEEEIRMVGETRIMYNYNGHTNAYHRRIEGGSGLIVRVYERRWNRGGTGSGRRWGWSNVSSGESQVS